MATHSIVPLSIPTLDLPQALFDELRAAVKGPVCHRSDPVFSERSKTFNGKLRSLARVLVSPLDAQDVSAAVRFCTKHGLSPSVRASGYGIAGWAVAGDLIIDLTLLRDIDIEAPIPHVEGDKDWTRLEDMPGNKGKGPAPEKGNGAGTVMVQASSPAALSSMQPLAQSPALSEKQNMKRRRDERDNTPPVPSSEVPVTSSDTHPLQQSYDAASHNVASFLRGPALPHEEGEKPRQPPTNRRRLHSPDGSLLNEGLVTYSQDETADANELPLSPPGPGLSSRQISNDSTSSASGSVSEFSFERSGTASSTSPSQSPEADDTEPSSIREQEPFGYMTQETPAQTHPPMYGSGNPFGSIFSTTSGSLPSPAGGWSAPSSMSPAIAAWSAAGGASMLPRPPFSSTAPFSQAIPFSMPGALSFGSGPLFAQRQMGTMAPAKPIHPHAYVTFGAGMRQKELDAYTAAHALEGISGVSGMPEEGVVPYHIPSSAHPVGSSIMLLAGFGFLSRMHGLSIDNLVEVEMVLADGRIVIVNEDDDPDLWWAVRGAGPAFGIATRYKARAFPVPVVFAGNLIYRFHRATAPSLIKHFRDCIKGCPRELYANVLLTAGPADKDSLVVIQMCYVGPKEKGIEYLQAISSWDGERCLLNEVNEKSYLNQQDSVAQVLRGKAGRQWFIRSALITSLPDEVIHKTVMQFANTPIGCTWLFELSGGAISDFEDTCLPKEQREATWTVAALHQWEMGIDDPRCITSAEEWIFGTIGTVATGGPYPTFLGRHEPPSRTMACYGKNWSRLADLKRKYDPDCLFKNNLWPLDKYGHPIELLDNEPPSP